MKQVDSTVEEHRDQFNAPIIVFRCPTCRRVLATLSAENSQFAMQMGLSYNEYLDLIMKEETRNILRLQVETRFVWSYKNKQYLSPLNFDGKVKFTRHDRKATEIRLKEFRRLLLIPDERTELVQRQIERMENELKNPPPPKDCDPEMIYEADLFMNLEKQFVCCAEIVLVNILPKAKYVIEETDANPRI